MFSQVVFLKHESHDYYLHFLRTCFINSLISLERVVFVKHLPYFPSLAVEHSVLEFYSLFLMVLRILLLINHDLILSSTSSQKAFVMARL